MINLIPPAAYKQIVREYWARVVTVGFFLVGSAFAVASITLFPPYFLISIQMHVVENVVSESSEKIASYDTSEKELAVASQYAQLLNSGESTSFTQYQDIIERIAGTGVVISSLTFNRNSVLNTGAISVGGVAKNRQVLATFRDELEAQDDFGQVDLPISNLIKDQQIPFMIQIVISSSTGKNI